MKGQPSSKKSGSHILNKSRTWACPSSMEDGEPSESDDSLRQNSEPVSLGTVVCLYSYNARNDTELNVDEGDHLILLEKANTDWWYCQNEIGECGFLPTTYIQEEFEGCVVTLTHSGSFEGGEDVREDVYDAGAFDGDVSYDHEQVYDDQNYEGQTYEGQSYEGQSYEGGEADQGYGDGEAYEGGAYYDEAASAEYDGNAGGEGGGY